MWYWAYLRIEKLSNEPALEALASAYLRSEWRSGSDLDIHLVFPNPLTTYGEMWRFFRLIFVFCAASLFVTCFFFASCAHFLCKYFWHGLNDDEEIFLLTTESLPSLKSSFLAVTLSYFGTHSDLLGLGPVPQLGLLGSRGAFGNA